MCVNTAHCFTTQFVSVSDEPQFSELVAAVISLCARSSIHLACGCFGGGKQQLMAGERTIPTRVATRNPSPRPLPSLTKAGLVLFSFVISNVFE